MRIMGDVAVETLSDMLTWFISVVVLLCHVA